MGWPWGTSTTPSRLPLPGRCFNSAEPTRSSSDERRLVRIGIRTRRRSGEGKLNLLFDAGKDMPPVECLANPPLQARGPALQRGGQRDGDRLGAGVGREGPGQLTGNLPEDVEVGADDGDPGQARLQHGQAEALRLAGQE